LADSSRREYETNEVSWWSNWAEAKWLDDDAYLIFSDDFDEYFFNRGGFVQITPASSLSIEPMEKEFRAHGRRPHIFLQSDGLGPKLLRTLEVRDYRIADQMAVMEMDDPSFAVNPRLKVAQVTDSQAEAWAEVYLDSFYGDQRQMRAVASIVSRLARVKGVDLILGEVDGRHVGTAAVYRTGKVCGVYCVGTHSGWRRKRVASTILEHCYRLARSEGRKLILQTILSDSVEVFYKKIGFRRVYLKELFVKDVKQG
jgi:GNAT superfamily N-acetyltransferase